MNPSESLIVGVETVDKALLDTMPNLKVIGSHTTGIDHIDQAECERRGIKILSLQGETEFLEDITSTSEHTIGLIIALARNYKTALSGASYNRMEYLGNKLAGKTLGIIGYGRIGQQVRQIAEAMGMNGHILDKGGNPDYLLTESDYVSLHIPLEGNEGYFTRDMFAKMKLSAYLINTSRNNVIEKGALVDALTSDLIAGAAVDFVDDPALVAYAEQYSNLILTPHIGGCTIEDMATTRAFIENKITNYLKNNV